MEIRCKKTDCTYNNGCSCLAPKVCVERGAECATYKKDELKQSLIIQNGNLFEVSEELVTKNLRDVPLRCGMRNCLYNQKECCMANGITIIDRGEQPISGCAECATYIER